LKLMMDVRYYRLEINGEQIVEIDLVNGKRVIGGVDQLADQRRAMGL
ncbi:MAG: phage major tail tube protein, partial [Rhodobacter sp.]|nr:phage major tail tube protein [Rhodobacter sp.]